MEKNKIRQRWDNQDMTILRGRVLGAILEKKKLEDVEGILYNDGKIDLRGLPFPGPSAVGEMRTYVIANNPFTISDSILENIDFSYCNLEYAVIENTTLNACLFENANLSYTRMDGVRMIDSAFRRSKFKDAFTRPYSEKKDDGMMKGVSFIECDFTKFGLGPIIVDKCLFKDCKFSETNISARLSDTQFIGKMEDTWFRGYPYKGTKLSLLDRVFMSKNDPKKRNRMVNVDLSKALLRGVFFTDGIDLSTCIFPEQDDYFRVDNFSHVFKKVKEKITSGWESPYKEKALSAIDRLFFDEHKTDMDIDFIYTGFDFPGFPADFNDRFFGLIKDINRTYLNDKGS